MQSVLKEVKHIHSQYKAKLPANAMRDLSKTGPFKKLVVEQFYALNDENREALHFHVIQNSLDEKAHHRLSTEQKFLLLDLKNVFSHQLPQMGKNYITRVVFDPRHVTLCLTKRCPRGKVKVIGGITFRPFYSQGFSEIVFCVVSASEQVKGYGSRMMNFMKDYMVANGILYCLTFADQLAIGYFKKQGFTMKITLDKKLYEGHVKIYNGASLMECALNPLIIYSDMSHRLLFQKLMVSKMIEKRQSGANQIPIVQYKFKAHRVVPALFFEGLIDRTRIRLDLTQIDFQDHSERLAPQLKSVLKKLRKHKAAEPFLKPVDTTEVTDYLDHIKYPIDLKMIAERLESRYYVNICLFHADVRRLISNCRMFNSTETSYYKCASELEKYYVKIMVEKGLIKCEDSKTQSLT